MGKMICKGNAIFYTYALACLFVADAFFVRAAGVAGGSGRLFSGLGAEFAENGVIVLPLAVRCRQGWPGKRKPVQIRYRRAAVSGGFVCHSLGNTWEG